jgi:hypothetical protein
VGLVRQYLTCVDELTSICTILQGKVNTLNQLNQLVEIDESKEKDVNLGPDEQLESATSRIGWAMQIVEDQHRCCQSLLEDLRLATQAVSTTGRSSLPMLTRTLALPTSLYRAE